MTTRINRRRFMKQGITAVSTAAVAPALWSWKKEGLVPSPKTVNRTLGKTGLTVPIVSMGVMNADNPDLVAAALDSGIVLLDTAHGYQRGKNEEMVGQVVKG